MDQLARVVARILALTVTVSTGAGTYLLFVEVWHAPGWLAGMVAFGAVTIVADEMRTALKGKE
jgi:hypothetical protein